MLTGLDVYYPAGYAPWTQQGHPNIDEVWEHRQRYVGTLTEQVISPRQSSDQTPRELFYETPLQMCNRLRQQAAEDCE